MCPFFVLVAITDIRELNLMTVFDMCLFFYRFGAIFNMFRLLVDDFRGGFENGAFWQRIFDGYTITTWMVVFNLGSTGLLVSWLMKYADNIVKVIPFLYQYDPYGFWHLITNG